jgi:hypothetical protein
MIVIPTAVRTIAGGDRVFDWARGISSRDLVANASGLSIERLASRRLPRLSRALTRLPPVADLFPAGRDDFISREYDLATGMSSLQRLRPTPHNSDLEST